MFKRFLLLVLIFISMATVSEACVGRILFVGAIDSPGGRAMAETVSLLITERTGTTVNTVYYDNIGALYDAVRKEEAGILVENSIDALKVLKLPPEPDRDKAYITVKEAFRKDMNLVWLSPFKFLKGAGQDQESLSAPVLSFSVMTDFPGLPRLLNKLAEKMDDRDYSGLVQAVSSGIDPKAAAKDFLNSKKLI